MRLASLGLVIGAFTLLACSSRPSVHTGGAGSNGKGGSGGGAGSGSAGVTGVAGDTGSAGTTGVGGSTGVGGGDAGASGANGGGGFGGGAGASVRSPTFDVCTCACTCAQGAGTSRDTPCWPNAGELCTCDTVCRRACPNSGFGSFVSATGSCAHTDVPVLWSCPLTGYGSGDGCTCGCGAHDPDCPNTTAAGCKLCNARDSCATSCAQITVGDNATCVDVPATWTCSPGFFGRGDGCDCGCGAVDPDCVDATRGACEFCANPGSCAASGLCAEIALDDNTSCR